MVPAPPSSGMRVSDPISQPGSRAGNRPARARRRRPGSGSRPEGSSPFPRPTPSQAPAPVSCRPAFAGLQSACTLLFPLLHWWRRRACMQAPTAGARPAWMSFWQNPDFAPKCRGLVHPWQTRVARGAGLLRRVQSSQHNFVFTFRASCTQVHGPAPDFAHPGMWTAALSGAQGSLPRPTRLRKYEVRIFQPLMASDLLRCVLSVAAIPESLLSRITGLHPKLP